MKLAESKILQSILNKTFFLFVISFILTLPFHYNLFPNIGQFLRPFTESLNQNFVHSNDLYLHSDSSMMITNTIALFLLSLVASIFWAIIRKKNADSIHFWLYRMSAYYLSLTLLIYGCNKLFKYQFFFPEPNTLFTPLGQLSPDILYWSSMGSSLSYNIFAGLLEILPALLLLFSKTRMLGALIALGVLINVMMINIGFGIEVKTYTSFLILLSLILIQPHIKRLYAFFISNTPPLSINQKLNCNSAYLKKNQPILKLIVIAFIFSEALLPYFTTGQWNGDKIPKIYMHGAYNIEDNPLGIERVFIHNGGYFITQDKFDHFSDFQMTWNQDILTLTNYENHSCQLSLFKKSRNTFQLTGLFFNKPVNWKLKQVELKQLAIFNN